MRLQERISTLPDVQGSTADNLLKCIEECYSCAQSCTACAEILSDRLVRVQEVCFTPAAVTVSLASRNRLRSRSGGRLGLQQ